MGFSCHVAKLYQVEYGHACFSGSEQEYINSTLQNLCPGLWHSDDYISTSQDLEVPRDELEEAIKEIESDKEHFNQEIKDQGLSLSAEELISCFNALLTSADPNNNFIRLAWF